MYNKVHLIDCMEFMKDKPNGFYDLAVVDPPYGIKISKNPQTRWNYKIKENKDIRTGRKINFKRNPHKSKEWDNKKPDSKYFKELFRIAKHQCIFGMHYFMEELKSSPCVIAWDKVNGNSHFGDCDFIWTNFKTHSRIIRFMWNGFLQGKSIEDGCKRQGNIKKLEYRIHVSQKPIALYKWLLQNYAKPGWKILDTHVGSGSSRIACYDMGFWFEGCELDPDYWQAQEDRFQNHIANRDLPGFGEEVKELIYQKELL